jgi:3',5'-cyclic AMP phosphodiesterase CpdA
VPTVIHLSDLHFGTVRDAAVQPLIDAVSAIRPDLIAVSGDLTQRAREHQFRAARAFLDALPGEKIIVPGNHDVPLYNLRARFHRLERYCRYIQADLEPFYCNGGIAVLGINTARSLTFKNGRINEQQVARAKSRLCALPDSMAKIIVTHHPFDLPAAYSHGTVVGRARMAIKELNDCRVDLFLAGHFHVSGAAPSAFQIPVNGYSSLVVQAGTAISTRVRNEENTFNVIRIDLPEISIERTAWIPSRSSFAVSGVEQFVRLPAGWSRMS